MNLNDIIGKRVVNTACEHSTLREQIDAAQIVFDDGLVLDINIEARYCDDAWLEFTFVESTKAEGAKHDSEAANS